MIACTYCCMLTFDFFFRVLKAPVDHLLTLYHSGGGYVQLSPPLCELLSAPGARKVHGALGGG